MIRFTENEIEQLITDDAPMGDLTTMLLELNTHVGYLNIVAREPFMVCGTEEAVRVFEKLNISVNQYLPSGTLCDTGDRIISTRGNAAALHAAWRAVGTMIEFSSGIASRTHHLVNAAHRTNPSTTVAGSRKHAPYLKKISLKALMTGGAIPHRVGLSDTILISREHLSFIGGYAALCETVSKIRKRQKERMIVVEAHTKEEALHVAQSGADFIQLDKMTPALFHSSAIHCKRANPDVKIIATGGINSSNAGAYAEAGADVLVTSWMYSAPPANIGVSIEAIGASHPQSAPLRSIQTPVELPKQVAATY